MTADWARGLDPQRPVAVTGVAGFIGMHVAARLLGAGVPVVGVDALTPYYDPALKRGRLARLSGRPGFAFERLDLADSASVTALWARTRPQAAIHLAAQPGVRYSLEAPQAYVDANVTGFLSVLEACRAHPVGHLVYASSSSVYGGNTVLPFAVEHGVDHPVSLYAATKKANELMAHTYAHLFGVAATGLRFFTVYGPWGRPDMAVWLFTEALHDRRPIRLFNHGDTGRDFTYVDDIVEGVLRLLPHAPRPDPEADRTALTPATSWAPHRVLNIGSDRPEDVTTLLAHLERLTGREAIREPVPMQPGDVERSWADVSALEAITGWRPSTPLAEGLAEWVDWYRGWRGLS